MEKYLPSDYKLKLNNEIYTIEGKIGNGATCAAYLAEHNNQHFIIKEYCPSYIAFTRDDDGNICFTDDKQRSKFEAGLMNYRESFKRQKKIRENPEITNSTPFTNKKYECNNTEYIIVVQHNGATYGKIIDEKSITERIEICCTIAKTALKYHNAGFLMLDIKPENVFVLPETNELILYIDYDSIRTKGELAFGNSLSYTKEWAAPEQVNPYSYDEISPQTDIYTLGELVYWSIFDKCHSNHTEHRRLSTFPFDDKSKSFYSDFENPEVQRLFTELFHMTIRSSVLNRAESMQDVIDKLEEIKKELEKENYILPSVINRIPNFVGREEELIKINEYLNEYDILFISGVGGIGKSVLAREYARKYYGDCCYYITYNDSLEMAIINDISIRNFSRYKEENDHDHCLRKLRLIRQIASEYSILIIDNMNIRISEMEKSEHEIWREIKQLPCCKIITTRCSDIGDYCSMAIERIQDEEKLIKLYVNNYEGTVDEEQRKAVISIINRVSGHTLLVEMVAKQAKTAFLSPVKIDELLAKNGIMSFDADNITINDEEDTIKEIIKKLLDISRITENREKILMQLSFMPFEGIDGELFKEFFNIKENNDINWLINHGYIKRENNEISIYPIVAEVMADKIKRLDSMEFFYSQISEMLDNGNFNKGTYTIFDSVSQKTVFWNLINQQTIQYLLGYINQSREMSRFRAIDKIIDFVLNYYKITFPDNRTIDDLYNIKYKRYLFYLGADIDEALEICRERYENANKDCNKFWRGIWGHNLFMAEKLKNNVHSVMYDIKNILDVLPYDDEKESEYAYIEYYEILGMEYSINRLKRLNIIQLQEAIKSRESMISGKDDISNKIQICIDKAYYNIYDYKFNLAIDELLETIENYSDSGNILLSQLYKLLGDVYSIIGSNDLAYKSYDEAINIIKDMDDSDDYFLYLRRDRAYYLMQNQDSDNKIEKNKSRKLYNEILNFKSDDRLTRTMYAHACYNMGLIYELEQDYNKALTFFQKADEYMHPTCFMDRYYNICLDIDSAIHAVLLYRKCNNNNHVNQILKNAYDMSRKRLGNNHPYTKKFKEIMEIKE